MPATDFDAERDYDEGRFTAREIFRSERAEVALGYFEPGQFIPVHAPESDLTVCVRRGTGLVREGSAEHRVAPGDVVVVPAGTDRGIRADADGRLEALLVTAPPPTDAEHDPVRRGLRTDDFEPGDDS